MNSAKPRVHDAISHLTLITGKNYDVWSDDGISWSDDAGDYWLTLNFNNKEQLVHGFPYVEITENWNDAISENVLYTVIGFCIYHKYSLRINDDWWVSKPETEQTQ